MNLIIPNSVERIGHYAFLRCNEITNVVLSSNLITIGQLAFAQCGNIREITIPSSVKHIQYHAFGDCTKIENIYLLSTDENIVLDNGVFSNVSAKFYCSLSGPGGNWSTSWQNKLTEIHWNYQG